MHSLTLARYQMVLCGVQYAEAGNFLLLNQHRAFQSFVPFIVIAEVAQSELAKRALEQQGVEDIVVWPLHQGQLEDSLREAMYLYQMRVTIAHRRQTLNTLRSWQSFPLQQPPRDRMDEYLLPRQSLQACERTIQRIETNLQYLTDVVDECERRAKMRAVEHLGLLGSSRR